MATRIRALALLIGASISSLSAGCGSGETEEGTASLGQALVGDLAGAQEGRFVVSLGYCSGVLISPRAILTAGHCVPGTDDRVSIAVRRGARGDECLSGGPEGVCREVTLTVQRHWDVDLALLTSTLPMVKDAPDTFPVIDLGGEPEKMNAWGFGSGSFYSATGELVPVPNGTALVKAPFVVTQAYAGELHAVGDARYSTCDGDSGGPATRSLGSRLALVGILRASEAAPDAPQCTKVGGLQVWIRPGAYVRFLNRALNGCQRRTIEGRDTIDCSRSFAKLNDGGIARVDLDAEIIADYRNAPGFVKELRAGESVPEGLTAVTVVTPTALHNVAMNPHRMAALSDLYPQVNGQPEAPRSDLRIWKERGWSQGLDSRYKISGTQAPEVLRMQADFTQTPPDPPQTITGVCTATLIGKRLVRTAAHCLMKRNATGTTPIWGSNIRLDLYRDGSSVRLTFAPSWYEIGGYYISKNCWNDKYADPMVRDPSCLLEDWALLVLPANVWSTIGITPAYMGYAGLTSGSLNRTGTSAGYPACGKPNSPPTCTYSSQYDNFLKYADTNYDCRVSKFVNGTTVFRSGCDISGGNSGGPFYDPTTRHLLGHACWEACTTCAYNPNGTPLRDALTVDDFYFPNVYLGHNTWLFNEQNRLRSAYP
jgi:hypothetical protein